MKIVFSDKGISSDYRCEQSRVCHSGVTSLVYE